MNILITYLSDCTFSLTNQLYSTAFNELPNYGELPHFDRFINYC